MVRKLVVPFVLLLAGCTAPAVQSAADPVAISSPAQTIVRTAGGGETPVCDGHWLRLLEPNEIPACAKLDEWHACIVLDDHDPTAVQFEVTPLPPIQASPTVAAAPRLGVHIAVVTAAEHYELGAMFWIHAFPNGSKPPDCGDVHVGFPFYHGTGQ